VIFRSQGGVYGVNELNAHFILLSQKNREPRRRIILPDQPVNNLRKQLNCSRSADALAQRSHAGDIRHSDSEPGLRRFDEFRHQTGLLKSVVSDRLKKAH